MQQPGGEGEVHDLLPYTFSWIDFYRQMTVRQCALLPLETP